MITNICALNQKWGVKHSSTIYEHLKLVLRGAIGKPQTLKNMPYFSQKTTSHSLFPNLRFYVNYFHKAVEANYETHGMGNWSRLSCAIRYSLAVILVMLFVLLLSTILCIKFQHVVLRYRWYFLFWYTKHFIFENACFLLASIHFEIKYSAKKSYRNSMLVAYWGEY